MNGRSRSRRLALCYHALSEDWPAVLAVTPDVLERQVRDILRRGFEPVTFTRLVVAPPTGNAFAVTFDDGFRSVPKLAAPVLAKLNVPGTLFVSTAFPDAGKPLAWPGIDQWRESRWAHELASASWDEIRDLVDGGWEIGSHTVSHCFLPDLDDESLRRELVESRGRCEEETGAPCSAIAYPFGRADARVIAAAREAGYSAGGLLAHDAGAGVASGERLAVRRLGVYPRDSAARLRVKEAILTQSPAVTRWVRTAHQRLRRPGAPPPAVSR